MKVIAATMKIVLKMTFMKKEKRNGAPKKINIDNVDDTEMITMIIIIDHDVVDNYLGEESEVEEKPQKKGKKKKGITTYIKH